MIQSDMMNVALLWLLDKSRWRRHTTCVTR